jgi:UDP-N-acetyl-2-amino-2-deoxyglucuronate dehydrogenase
VRQVAMIGVGAIADRHHEAWRQHGDVRLAMVVDSQESCARRRAQEWKVDRWSTDYEQALADETIDIVDICLPHNLHFRTIQESIQAGKHVLIEKPIAVSLDECSALIELDLTSHQVIMVAENWRFAPQTTKAVELIEAGVIGAIFAVQASIRFFPSLAAFEGPRHWHLEPEAAGGGVMLNSGVHCIATLEKLVGRISAVSAAVPPRIRPDAQVDDTIWALVRFEDGAVGYIDVSWATVRSWRNFQVSIFGSEGTIDFDIGAKQFALTTNSRRDDISLPESEGFVEEIAHFLNCIERGLSPESNVRIEARAVAIALTVERAARLEDWVPIPEL